MGAMDLTARQYLLLKALDEQGPLGSRTICETLLVTPADVTGLSTRLERKHYVHRIRSLEDRRRVTLEITDSGRKALENAGKKRDRVVDSLIQSMTPLEFRMTLKGMGRMLSVLGPGSPSKAADNPTAPAS